MSVAVTQGDQHATALARGIAELGLTLSVQQQDQLLAYLSLLNKWNSAFNLTAVRDPAAMVTRHLLDGLSILPWVNAPRLLDVGTGAGLPGLLIAICRPETAVTLLDSNGKKTRFLNQVVAELQLSNVTVVKSRVESFASPAFDQITCRAYAALADFVRSVSALVGPQTQLLAMKGARPDAEIATLPPGYRVAQVIELAVPGLAEARHLIIIETASGQPTGAVDHESR